MIRIATEADVAAMLAIYAPYVENTTYTFEYTVPTTEEFIHRFREITQQFPWLVWEQDGVILGYAYGSLPFVRAAYAWAGEVSIYLAPEAQGRGIGRRLYTALEALMEHQGYRILYAIITEENLKEEETRKFIDTAFRDGSVKTSGTDIDKLMPPMTRFGGGNRAEKKKTIIDKLVTFFDRFFGIG